MKITMVVKRTRVETADARALKLLRENDPSVAGWSSAHEAHSRTVEVVQRVLDKLGMDVSTVKDPYRPFGSPNSGLVLVVGGDGTFLAASHSVSSSIPMLGVNSDPATSRGFFCGLDSASFEKGMKKALSKKGLPRTYVPRMSVSVNGVVRSKHVLNEALLCHPHPAATSRYYVNFGDSDLEGWEKHVSSGVWVGPPAGTTGAIRSAGGDVLPITEDLLELVSREAITGASRKVVTSHPIRFIVKNDEAAVYMDGPYKHAVLTLGDRVELRLSDEHLVILGLGGRR